MFKYKFLLSLILYLFLVSADELFQPNDIIYLGAFSFPLSKDDKGNTWAWGGHAVAFKHDGDPEGRTDGFTGSLYSTSHAYKGRVSEISIPKPKKIKVASKLPVAKQLKPFMDVHTDKNSEDLFHSIKGMVWIKNSEKDVLYFCREAWGYDDYTTQPTHGLALLNGAKFTTYGLWRVGSENSRTTSVYVFEIPKIFRKDIGLDYLVATGKYRAGLTNGPCIYAIAPPKDLGDLQTVNSVPSKTLLKYSMKDTINNHAMADKWNGVAWLTIGNKSSVVMFGLKGRGESYYGNPKDDWCGYKGWHSYPYETIVMFFKPSDLIKNINKSDQVREPQPYAELNISKFMLPTSDHQTSCTVHTGGLAYDRKNGLLYFSQLVVNRDRPIIHVFKVK